MIPLPRCPDGRHLACDGWLFVGGVDEQPCLCCCHGALHRPARPSAGRRPRADKQPCGTPAGYARCAKQVGGACPPCKKARTEYRTARRRANGQQPQRPAADLASCAALLAAVADAFGVTVNDLTGPSCARDGLTDARLVGYWLARQRGLSYPEIARLFGRSAHQTVMSGVRRAEASGLGSRYKFLLTSTG